MVFLVGGEACPAKRCCSVLVVITTISWPFSADLCLCFTAYTCKEPLNQADVLCPIAPASISSLEQT